MRAYVIGAAVGLLLTASSAFAQSPPASPPLTRWFELQTLTFYSRYHFVENDTRTITANQLQYKQVMQARFNADPGKRLTLNAGFFSGGSFIGTWNAWGVGTGTFDGHDNYLKQLYLSWIPARGVDVQAGGLYVHRGEEDDIISYDEDGYLVGERLTLRRARQVYVDDLTVTRGTIGPYGQPSVLKRWQGFDSANYTQAMIAKRFGRFVGASIDYTTQSGARTVRAAFTLRLPAAAPLRTVRYEQYRRLAPDAAGGFAAWCERSFTSRFRLQAGYATIDRLYGGWNADRFQSGRRVFAVGAIPIRGPLSAQVFATYALSSAYAIPLKRRFDATLSYDVLAALRHTGWF